RHRRKGGGRRAGPRRRPAGRGGGAPAPGDGRGAGIRHADVRPLADRHRGGREAVSDTGPSRATDGRRRRPVPSGTFWMRGAANETTFPTHRGRVLPRAPGTRFGTAGAATF